VVFGCGGVGIAAIQGARIAGAAEIVAVDLVEEKLEQAKTFGATHACKPDDLAALQAQLTGDGFDYAFEAIGHPTTMRAAFLGNTATGTRSLTVARIASKSAKAEVIAAALSGSSLALSVVSKRSASSASTAAGHLRVTIKRGFI